MKKGLVLIVTMIVMLVAAACGSSNGGNGGGNSSPSPSAPSEPSPTSAATEEPAGPSYDKLVLGTSADYAPFEFKVVIDGVDTIVGFDIEIAKEIAKDLGAELEIQDLDFDSLLMALNTDKVDFVLAGMNPDDERRQAVDFSSIYYNASQGVLVKKDGVDQFNTVDDLKGKKIGVQRGSTQEGLAQEIEGAKLTSLAKIPELIMELTSGRVDALIVERPVAEQYLTTQDSIALSAVEIEQPIEETGFAAAVKKGNQELLDAINATLDRLIAAGDVDRFVVEANELAGEAE